MGLNPSPENGSLLCSRKGVSCDENGENIVMLELSGLGLSGAIPDATIGKLKKLESLDLSNNKITTLPNDFGSLGSLKYLNLSFNQISGIIPSNIGNFGQLQRLDLSFNNFHGCIPEAISSLTRLQVLSLSNNQLDSIMPLGLLNCRPLVFIDLSFNNLNGSLHNGFGAAFPELRFLNLAENRFLGRASNLIGLKSIRYLNVSGNLFGGSVVGVYEGLMEVIDLSRNRFQGHMAQVRSNSTFNWSKLVYLDISENQFSGEFSTDLTHLALNLEHLNLAHNRFSKQQFLRVDLFSSLENLNLSATNMIGPISSNISLLSSLRFLDLSHNHLSNRIPTNFTKNLDILDLSYNQLTGDIPYGLLQELRNMDTFNFSYNNLNFCAPQFSGRASFIGLTKSCPIAADSGFFRRNAPKHKGMKLAFVLTFSLTCLLAGLLFVAFGYRYKTAIQAAKLNPGREVQTMSGPFSFQTGSTTWVADVSQPTSVPVVIFHKPLLNFTFSDLLNATSNFDRGTLLAEGRFGPVYGGLLPGGIHVAVKVLVRGSTMTDQEAARELEYLGRIKHHNLVPLTGYCLAGDQRIAIYEYMENGNLQNLLYDLPLGVQTTEDWEDENNGIMNVGSDGSLTTWRFRHKIALGAARALAFLHHGCSPPIIHRDIKASSVYLDSNLEPRLSDFGLAKIFGNGLEDEISRGSPGYVPPEFIQPENSSPRTATPKSDVYGFGVILLELITGKKPNGDDYPGENEGNLVSWVRGLVRRNQGSLVIDPKIHGTGPDENMVEVVKIGYLCTAEIPSKRPSMHQVVGLLKDLEPYAQ
ncbi:probable LRR receptor-like serine/threonine-protein kinase at2g24230 [Phtheirospermum japonicum]|uniref:Probable LRR receptor-like serine/threonine-protein kinase at2g24230 n=1 Tax=Phtheirospermum japonicum TaxID=374723 RepID=A0A830BED2_9LAMI|nr:probable LRR receptor-like serine/threonine-protein kinase at2g24230 [Phtheirospermum japonicum]